MSTFRSRQRAAQRRQPTTPAERNNPAAGQQPPGSGQGQGKPRFGNPERREGGFSKHGSDKPRFGGNEQRREGGPKREGEFQQRGERQFDKPRFGGDNQRREGGFKREGEFQPRGERNFDQPRHGAGDKPRYSNEHREGGFKREGEFQPRGERKFDQPRHGAGDKPRYSNEHREGGFKREGEFQPRGERQFDKPRFGGNEQRHEGAPKREGESQPRGEREHGHHRQHDHREGGFRRNDGMKREGSSQHQRHEFQPRGDHAIEKPRTLFGGKSPAANPPAAEEAQQEKRYTRDRVAGRGGKTHPDYVAPPSHPEPEADSAPAASSAQAPRTSFLKRVNEEQADAPREQAPRSFDKPRFGGERREGEFQPRGERSFDKPRFGGERREGGFQRDNAPRRDDAAQPRQLFGKGQSEGGEHAAKAGRTAFVKTQFRALQENELALFASYPRGLEKILADEITLQGGSELQLTDGGIAFIGNREVMMRVNLHSRVASRLLMQLSQGSFQEERDIYALARAIDWPALFAVGCTIKVNTDGHARLRSMDYVSLLVKDAICDRFREACGERPSVDTRHPDMRIRVFISGFDVQIYLDTSGEALFKRGWREETGEAPLRENLAAGILLLAGYNGSQPLLDPMCGSGTFLVEAADIALNRAPGRERHFAFEQLIGHNDILWHSVRNDAVLAQRQLDKLPLYGNDRDPELVAITRRNLARAEIEQLVTLSCGDATTLAAPAASGLIVCNPPYGVRLDEQESLAELYPLLATWLKRNFAGWHAHFMTADTRLPALMRLSTSSRPQLFNGPLACHVYGFELVAGSNRKEKAEDDSQ